ncbi:uncharacterized protein LOC133834747 [Humulus lupulus]|uniref:uncharacterized protein LOC133834747 n=1 Tax=Humulus lupulus TaxID=3486 RepID=UPI002B404652|nr:uncharacterized protein LOC133834747 [Humulus lupulus]
MAMDFVVGFPRTTKQHGSTWVIIDRLTNLAYFLPVKTTYIAYQYAELYVKEIMQLHGVPKFIISDRVEKQILGPEAVREASEAVEKIRTRMLTAQSRQKSYTDSKCREVEFTVGDLVFLRVSPMKGMVCFGKRGKLSPRYIGPFEILDKVGQVAYHFSLPPALTDTYNVFHISMLQKYVSDLSHVLSYKLIKLRQDLSYDKQPVQIIEKGIKELRFQKIPLVKVLWKNCSVREAT